MLFESKRSISWNCRKIVNELEFVAMERAVQNLERLVLLGEQQFLGSSREELKTEMSVELAVTGDRFQGKTQREPSVSLLCSTNSMYATNNTKNYQLKEVLSEKAKSMKIIRRNARMKFAAFTETGDVVKWVCTCGCGLTDRKGTIRQPARWCYRLLWSRNVCFAQFQRTFTCE